MDLIYLKSCNQTSCYKLVKDSCPFKNFTNQDRIFKVVPGQRNFIFTESSLNFRNLVFFRADILSPAEKLPGYIFQAVTVEFIKSCSQRLRTVNNNPPLNRCREKAASPLIYFDRLKTPSNFKRNTVKRGPPFNKFQIKTYYMPSDDNIRIIFLYIINNTF